MYCSGIRMALSGDTAGLDTNGCEGAVVSSAWGAELDNFIPCGPSRTPSLCHIPTPRLCAGSMAAHGPISDPYWLEQRGAVVRHWKPSSGDEPGQPDLLP